MLVRSLVAARLLALSAAVLFLLALNAAVTGGIGTRIGTIRVSSHNPYRAALYGSVCALAALLLYRRTAARSPLRAEIGWWLSVPHRLLSLWRTHGRRWPVLIVAVAAISIDVVQWWRGAPLWLDEEMIAVNFRDRSFADLAGRLWLGQSAPLGWLWLERAVLLLGGPGERVLRLIPLLFGVATTVAAAWIARRWLNPLGGVLLVTLCTVGSTISHYRFELKHYSADVFWALLLPALAVWSAQAGSPKARSRRQLAFAGVAGLALWTAYGALFVAPGCLLWMFAEEIRRRDHEQAVRLVRAAAVWLMLFGINYAVSLRYTHENEFLRHYWADRVPPASEGLAGRLAWMGDQLPELGRRAGGTDLPALLFSVGLAGLLLAPDRRLAIVYAGVPLAGIALSVMRLVPVYERFSLWIVPTLYLGLAFSVSRGISWLARGMRERRVPHAAAGVLTCMAALPVSWDIANRGWQNLDLGGPADTNHGMDDKRAVAWLMHHRQPGDAIVTTGGGWPAIWWYGGISLADHPDGRMPDGTVLYEVSYDAERQRCDSLPNRLRQHRRVLLFVSFPDAPDDFYRIVEAEMLRFGSLAAHRQFTTATTAAVFRIDPISIDASPEVAGSSMTGCISLEPAVRW